MLSLLVIFTTIVAGALLSRSIPTEELLQDRFALGQNYYAAHDHENSVLIFSEIEETPNFTLLNVDGIDVTIGDLVLPIRVAATYQLGNSYRNVGRTKLERSRNLRDEGNEQVADERRRESLAAFDSARQYYHRVQEVEDAPLNVRAMSQYQIVRASFQTEDYAGVVVEAQVLLDKFPGSDYEDAAIYDSGWALYYQGKYRETINAFARLLEVSEDALKRDRAIFQTAESYMALGDRQEARIWYGKLVDSYDFSSLSGKELNKMKAQRLRGLVQETTRELVAKAQIRIADSYAEEGDIDNAIAAYSLVPERYPQESLLTQKSFDNMAKMVLERQGVDAGIRVLRQAQEQVEDRYFRGRVQLRMAGVLYRAERYREAIDEYNIYRRAYGDLALTIGVGLDQILFSVGDAYRELAREENAPVNYRLASESYVALLSDYPNSPRAAEAHYGLGHAFFGLGQLDSSRVQFDTAVAEHPGSSVAPHALNWQARVAFIESDHAKALSLYQELINRYPESNLIDQAWKDLGLVHKVLGQLDLAIEAFSMVGESYEGWTNVQTEAGDLLLAAGRVDEIETRMDLEGALKKADAAGNREGMAELHYILGRVARERAQHAQEIDHFTQAVTNSANPTVISFSRFFRGLAHYQMGAAQDAAGDTLKGSEHFVDSVADLDVVLEGEVSPEMKSVAYRTRGVALTRLGRSNDAIQAYEALIGAARSSEERIEFELMLMELYYDLGQLQATEGAARRLIGTKGQGEQLGGFSTVERAYFVLVSLLLEQERYEESYKAATDALRRFPKGANAPTLMLVSARALFFMEKYAAAAQAFNRFIAGNPDSPEVSSAYFQLGMCGEILGDYEAAAQAFRTLAERFPADALVPEALYRAGESLYNSSQFEQALGVYLDVVERFPVSEQARKALYSASWTYMDMDQKQASIASMERLVASYPESGYARYAQFSIGDYYYSNKEYEKAQVAYQKVTALFPETQEAGKAESLLADLAEDLASLEYDRVFADFDQGNYAAAVRGFDSIYESFPESYSALAALANKGVALEHLGNSEKARRTYEQVLTVAADKPENGDIAKFAQLRLENL